MLSTGRQLLALNTPALCWSVPSLCACSRASSSQSQPRTAAMSEQLAILSSYTACDVADALVKLKVPHAGFLPDITFRTAHLPPLTKPLVAPATTATFVPKTSPTPTTTTTSSIPPGAHYADLATPERILVISQPANQRCAVLGGLIAQRLAKRGVLGAVVDGRVRDVSELQLPVFSAGTSAVGSALEAKCVAVDEDVEVGGGVKVRAGDVVVADAVNGVVVVPREVVGDVVELLPVLTGMDRAVAEDVERGRGLAESFKERRK